MNMMSAPFSPNGNDKSDESTLSFRDCSFSPEQTPLRYLPRFSERVGAPVFVKQDDAGPLSWAGTKARKIRRILLAAERDNTDVLVMCGPAQSNSCRALAAGAAATGIRVILLLRGVPPSRLTGNLLILEELGAELRWAGNLSWPQLSVQAAQLVTELNKSGLSAIEVAPGCSTVEGVVAIVDAAREVAGQLRDYPISPDTIVHASASGGMHAGFAIAHAEFGTPAPQSVMIVRDIYDDIPGHYADLISRARTHLGLKPQSGPGREKIDWSFVGKGYGVPTQSAIEAGRLLAQSEGLLVESVYTGKALAAVVDHGRSNPGKPVLFWHSGGMPVYFTDPLTE